MTTSHAIDVRGERTSVEVFHSRYGQVSFAKEDLEQLVDLASTGERNRMRFCAHKSREETIHEMFIVHPKGAYVRPHKHLGKTESILILSGEALYITFSENGEIQSLLEMGDLASGNPFYQRIESGTFHTFLIKSDWLVFLEVTSGPFTEEETLDASWSPLADQEEEINQFMCNLETDAQQFMRG